MTNNKPSDVKVCKYNSFYNNLHQYNTGGGYYENDGYAKNV